MARINFVPGRGLRARCRRRRLAIALTLSMLCAPPVFVAAEFYLVGENQNQRERNTQLREIVHAAEKKLAPARQARLQSLVLEKNLAILHNLQQAATLRAQLLSDLANRNPGGVSYASLNLDSSRLRITGVARSGDALSQWLARLSETTWFGEPLLDKDAGRFTLSLRHTAQPARNQTE